MKDSDCEMNGFSAEKFLEVQYPFVRDDVLLVARVWQHSGKQHLVIRQVDTKSGKTIREEKLECIHAALAEISPDELEEFRTDSETNVKRISSLITENLGQVDLSIDERFKAFGSWVAGISEAGTGAFQLQTELEGALPVEVPIAGFLMGFFARIDPEFLPTHLDSIERASWHEGTRHAAFLIANLLPVLDILAMEKQDIKFQDAILELVFDLDPPLDLFLEADRYLRFLLHPKAFPIIEKGIKKTGLFGGMLAKEAAQKFVQEIASFELYWGVPLVALESSFLETVKRELGINIPPLDDDRWISRTGFLARWGHITKLDISRSDQEYYDAKQADSAGKKCALPDTLGALTSLRTLQIENLPIRGIPDTIGQLQSLQILKLSHTRISTLPASIGNLQVLKSLEIDGYEFKSVPDTIGNLAALETLCLRGNEFDHLPDSMRLLKSLRTLILKGDFKELPQAICDLQSLEELALSNSNITTIPTEISGLSSLQKLYLVGNKISCLPELLLQCKHLKSLALDYNTIKELPDWIGSFQSLKILTVSQNLLEAIPPSIRNLTELEHLDLTGNKITELPPGVMQLSSLKRLFLDEEVISALPAEIQKWMKKRGIRTSAC